MKVQDLARFLVKAKKKTYAGGGAEVPPQCPGKKDLEYREGDWYYRDSYSGFYQAPGQEIVYFKKQPVWSMAYSGGMREKFHGDEHLAQKAYDFLKKCLLKVEESKPFRGPGEYSEGDFSYKMTLEGDINDFSGEEKIFYQGKEVYRQYFIGGLIIHK